MSWLAALILIKSVRIFFMPPMAKSKGNAGGLTCLKETCRSPGLIQTGALSQTRNLAATEAMAHAVKSVSRNALEEGLQETLPASFAVAVTEPELTRSDSHK